MRRSSTITLFLLYISALLHLHTIVPIDNHHFYRASNFFYIFNETRLTQSGLTSLDATLSTGSTKHARTHCASTCKKSHTVNLEEIYKHNTEKFYNTKQNRFSLTEANFFYTKNLYHGFFLQAHCPFRHMILRVHCCHKKQFPLQNESSYYHSYATPTNKIGWGDLSLLTGWAYSYTKTESLDFIDTTCSVGLLLPTGGKNKTDFLFNIPLGYNGHVGIPLSYNCALGALEWITIGFHIGALFFFDATNKTAVHYDNLNTHYKKKTYITTRVHHGIIWDITTYFKADHFIKGLSLLFGYTFAQQQANHLTHHTTPYTIQHHYCSPYNGWNMHTFHFIAEYDFTQRNPTFGPRIGFMYNKQCGGKRVFKTNMKGGTCGLEICMKF